jgi:hypothetical protein
MTQPCIASRTLRWRGRAEAAASRFASVFSARPSASRSAFRVVEKLSGVRGMDAATMKPAMNYRSRRAQVYRCRIAGLVASARSPS